MGDVFARMEAAIRPHYADRGWLVACDVLPVCTGIIRDLRALGAERCLALAGSRGSGAAPDPSDADWRCLEVGGRDMMGAIRSSEAALAAVPDAIRAWVDGHDRAGELRAIGSLFSSGLPVAGRRAWGGRPAAWRALEDKTTVDGLWDRAGICRAPAEVVPVADLEAAHARLDAGAGTVWSGDNREGFHGGASFVRWVRSARDRAEVAAFLSAHCDTARVAPFLEGLPCSIHGIVLPDGVAVVRPVELVVLRRRGSTQFLYARAGTSWDPPPEDRTSMRAAARRVGQHLADELGYRGAFTVDGVLTAEGFRPTELNPRFGAALGVMFPSPTAPLYLFHLAVVEGVDCGPSAAELEAGLVAYADAHRRASAGVAVERPVVAREPVDVVFEGRRCREAGPGEERHAALRLGPGPAGGYLHVAFVPERLPVGESIAPRVAAAIGLADELFELGIGPLEAAADVGR